MGLKKIKHSNSQSEIIRGICGTNNMDKNIAIEFQGVGKQYRLGRVGTGTLQHDLNRFWQTRIMGREDPYLKIGEVNDRSEKAHSDYVWALKDINFKVEQGDVVGIIGKNGAGKSTLLKLLSHITAPSTGDIFYRGRIASLLEVGTGFHGELTGKENIYMNGAVLGMTKHEIKRKLDDIIEFASSGMTVRLGFAVAAFLEPEILVVDEVLTVGDAEFQKRAIGKMDDVAKGGRTVLFVSHNMGAVRNLCKSGIVLKDGMIEYRGTANAAVDRYLKVYADDYEGVSLADVPRTNTINGLIKITGIEFVNEQNEETSPYCGKFLGIKLHMDVKEDINYCSVSITIRDTFSNPIMVFPSQTTRDDFKLTKGMHTTCLKIPKLPLTAGQYRLGLWCEAKTPFESNRCADFIENVVKLNVEGDFYYPKGVVIDNHLMGRVVLCEHEWEVE